MSVDMNQRILLAHSYFLYFDAKQTRKMRPYAPLATLISASVLRDLGYSVSLFDAMLADGTEGFRRLLEETRPAVVAILEDNFNFLTKMCTTRMREAAFDMIGMARKAGARVVVNGSDASDRPHLYLEAGAEIVIVGETEFTLPELLAAWRESRRIDLIPGLILPPKTEEVEEGNLARTAPRKLVKDLDALPLPAWDLVDPSIYREAWNQAHGRFSWNMVTTRGCPYECSWCAKPLYGRRYAQRSPQNVAAEMLALQERIGPNHIWFADDIFGLSSQWIELFGQEVERRQARTPFTMQSRVDLMTPSACEGLARAGAEEAWVGVESGSQMILDKMRKGITLQQVLEATQQLKKNDVHASWFMQLGYPGEGWNEILSTRDLIREGQPHDIGVSVSYPLPGTEFHAQVESQLREKTNWSDSDDLAMLFQGTYTTEFYRLVRDLLHDEVTVVSQCAARDLGDRRQALDRRWQELGDAEHSHRNADPTTFDAAG